MAARPIYRVRFDVEVDPDVWFQLSTISELPDSVQHLTWDTLLRALRNEALSPLDHTLVVGHPDDEER